MDFPELLRLMISRSASDLHLTVNSPPRLRIDGLLKSIEASPLTREEVKVLAYSVLTDAQKHKFEENNELDLAFGVKGVGRFRMNVFAQSGNTACVIRHIRFKIPTFEELGLPPIIEELIKKPRGLVLVTGPTGSGKSTTLASMIDRINTDRHEHILTIEDPVEYRHPHKRCIVNQRELGADTDSFKKALKHVLRQDPDVVLVGEMRDLETIEAALTIAETGHVCFATLHTNGAVQTINRIIDVFPPYQQPQVRVQLAFVLEGVISQQLIPRSGGKGRVLACEIMAPNPAIRHLIREDKIHQIYSAMQTGQGKHGMHTMNQALYALYAQHAISRDDALAKSTETEELEKMMLSGGHGSVGGHTSTR